MLTISLFFIGIASGSTGAILMKVGANQLPKFAISLEYVLAFVTNVPIVIGFGCYLLPGLIWVYLLSIHPVSFVQPVLALTYVLTPLLAMIILKEPVPTLRWIGILVIVIGVCIVSRS
ncbi:MAG: EamA family transporter [Candidatus Accumulibacter sp.]|nr:EamA family transporter [Accumulibacter sp.]